MALIQCDFFSPSLARTVTVSAVVPSDRMPAPAGPPLRGAPFKTLYLLHGITGNHTDWLAGTRVARWAQEKELVVVMPSGDNHFYVDNPRSGQLHGSFIAKDLVDFTRRTLPVSHNREDTFIGGLSMGGYGAIVNGLRNPDTFGRICAFSSALVLERAVEASDYTDNMLTNRGYYEAVFGDLTRLRGSGMDYDALAQALADAGGPLPEMYLTCGAADALMPANEAFRDTLLALGYSVTWEAWDGGHDWDFWDASIHKAIDWLP